VAIHECGIGLLSRQKREPHAPCPILNMSVNRVSTIFGLVSQGIQKRFGRYYAYSKYWLPLLSKEIEPRSLPHYEDGLQRSIHDFWPFIMGNQTVMHRLLCIYDVLTVFLSYNGHELLVASFQMELVVTVREAVMGTSLAYLPR